MNANPDKSNSGSARGLVNLYMRPRAIAPADFLHLVPGHDKPEFCRSFAEWLANSCRVDLVKICFEEKPRQHRLRLRKEVFPAVLRERLNRIRMQRHLERRTELVSKLDRYWPPQKTQRITAELQRRNKEFRKDYSALLTKQLSTRSPFQQVRFLNRHLKRLNLPMPACAVDRSAAKVLLATLPKDVRRWYTVTPPSSVAHEAVQNDYYVQNAKLTTHKAKLTTHKAKLRDLVVGCEMGRDLAQKMANRAVPGQSFWLASVAEAITGPPNFGRKPKPVTAALFNYSEEVGPGNTKRPSYENTLRESLKTAFNLNTTAIRLFVAAAVSEHLAWITRLHIGQFRATMVMGRNIHENLKRLAGDDKERANFYRQVHRAARHNPDVVRALQSLFFDGLPIQALRTRPGLFAKLRPALRRDVSLLVKFLFQIKSKGRLGLIPQALKIDAPGSQFRRKLVMHQTWSERVRLHRDGIKDEELAGIVDQLAGVPPEKLRRASPAAAEKFRRDEGLRYPS